MSQNNTATYDFESWYQNNLLGGFQAKELMVIASRQTGKSSLNRYFWNKPKPVEAITSAQVDGQLWYTVECNEDAAAWLRSQNRNSWYEHPATIKGSWVGTTTFDVIDKLHTILRVGFSA